MRSGGDIVCLLVNTPNTSVTVPLYLSPQDTDWTVSFLKIPQNLHRLLLSLKTLSRVSSIYSVFDMFYFIDSKWGSLVYTTGV